MPQRPRRGREPGPSGAKRGADFVLSAAAVLVLSPVLLALALVVRLCHGGPVLFCQPRVGRDNRVFLLYKFRTMTNACDASGRPLPDADRLTPFGRWLRSTSLDELPELWNVLRGDMSLVGPRPLLVDYLPLYTDEQARRHEVRPGLTGWAQVEGRNATTWEERFRQDVWYVDNASLRLDLRILIRTVATVLTRRGVNAPDHTTMPRFEGGSTTGRPDRAAA